MGIFLWNKVNLNVAFLFDKNFTAATTTKAINFENNSVSSGKIFNNGERDEEDGFKIYKNENFSFTYPATVNGKNISPVAKDEDVVVIDDIYRAGQKMGTILFSVNTLGTKGAAEAFRVKNAAGNNVRLFYDKGREAWIETKNITEEGGEKILSWNEAFYYFEKAGNVLELGNLGLFNDNKKRIYPYYEPSEPNLFGYRVFFEKEKKYIDIAFVTAYFDFLKNGANGELNDLVFILNTLAESASF